MSSMSLSRALVLNFLGAAPNWYKQTIVFFLVINPIVVALGGEAFAGWLLLGEFIFTLAMALKCYPLQPGGLLAIEAVLIGLTSPDTVLHKVISNFEVILLLMFMVAGIYFLKDLLLFVFSRILLGVRSKALLSLVFCSTAALLSAFLDALTVTAVVISVAVGFYGIYHRFASGKAPQLEHDHADDAAVAEQHRQDLENFRSFLRSLLMHAAVGTALGGVCTLVGEPQNLLIANRAGWDFKEFFLRMAPVTLPVLGVGLLTCFLLEKTRWFSYGTELPDNVRRVMQDYADKEDAKRTQRDKAALLIQTLAALWLVVGLALHLAAVGLVGLTVIIIATAFCGVIDEHRIGEAFHEALPFTALLTVFFAVVGVISDQQLFAPLVEYVLTLEGNRQATAFYLANGVLSAVSDNVFVATVYIDEVMRALYEGEITRDAFDMLAVAINTGTNIPSVATPNGQAAFLFLLTSTLAPLVRLSYGRMVMMALPYTLTMALTGLLMVQTILPEATQAMYEHNLIPHHSASGTPQAMPGAPAH